MDSGNNADDVPELATASMVAKPRLSYTQQEPTSSRFNTTGPFWGFEHETITPAIPRMYTALDLDSKFFPEGLKPGSIVEVRGAENCGKTFLLTYFLAITLRNQADKKVVMIDTSHQFNIKNLMSILAYGKDFQNTLTTEPILPEVMETTPEMVKCLDRLIVINCYTAEEFLCTVALKEDSLLEKLIKQNPDIVLIAIDTVDCYSMMNTASKDCSREILGGLRSNCANIPVICSTIKIPYDAGNNSKNSPADHANEFPCTLTVDPTLFTHTLSISHATNEEKEALPTRPISAKTAHYAKAYLRSKHRANIAGSAIHRVKFSIFSDMLWVDS